MIIQLQINKCMNTSTVIHSKSVLFFLAFFCSNLLTAQKNKIKNGICLEVVGVAVMNKNPLDGVNVTLYQENEQMEMDEITSVAYHEHGFMFKLERDQYYTIEVAKPGYVTRMIAISTKLPMAVIADPVFRYEFEVELFKEKKGINEYYLDFPIGLIDYDVKKEVFVSHGKYTSYIKNKIKDSMIQTKLDSAIIK